MTQEELTDAIADVLYDSLEMDWSTTDGARAVIANVPAVAAIPDLIAALETMTAFAEGVIKIKKLTDTNGICAASREIIAKARGDA